MRDPFTQIVNSFLRDGSLSATDVRVGTVIASHANSEAVAWPSTRLLTQEANLSRHLVESARAKLVKGEWLRKTYLRDRKGRITKVRYLVTEKILARRSR